MIIPQGNTPPDILAAIARMRVDLSPLQGLADQYVKNMQADAFFNGDPARFKGLEPGLVALAAARRNPDMLADPLARLPDYRLREAASGREEMKAPLEREALRASTEASRAGVARADSAHAWDVAARIEALKKPSDTDAILGAMGVPITPRTPPAMPPLPAWAMPTKPDAAPPPAGTGTPLSSIIPRPVTPVATPTDVRGTYLGLGTPAVPTAPAMPPVAGPVLGSPGTTLSMPGVAPIAPAPGMASPPASPSAWSGPAGAAMGLMATGRITPEAARGLIRGPAFAGLPDAVHTENFKMVHAAHEAAGAAEAMVGNVDQLKALAPQAFVGAGADVRAALAGHLSALGVSNDWLLARKSLPATQLLQQGLSQFIGSEAAKYKPISNSDITFIRSTLPNVSQDPVSMMNALEAMRKTALRQQLFETGRAQLMQTNPFPDLATLRARIKEVVPDHVFDPTLGAPAGRATPGGAAAPAASAAPPPGRYSWSPTSGLSAAPASPLDEQLRKLDATGGWPSTGDYVPPARPGPLPLR